MDPLDTTGNAYLDADAAARVMCAPREFTRSALLRLCWDMPAAVMKALDQTEATAVSLGYRLDKS